MSVKIGKRLSNAIRQKVPHGLHYRPTKELSDKLNIRLKHLSRLINGTAGEPTGTELTLLCEHFGIDLQDLNQETSCEKD